MGFVHRHQNVAVELIGVGYFIKPYVGIAHRPEPAKVVVGLLKVGSTEVSTLVEEHCIIQDFSPYAQWEGVVAAIGNLADSVTRMRFGLIVVVDAVFRNVHSHVDTLVMERGVGCVGDEILVETVISRIVEQAGNALSLCVQAVDGEHRAALKHLILRQVESQHICNGRVLYVIGNAVDVVRLTRMKHIHSLQALATYLLVKLHLRVHVAKVIHRVAQVLTRQSCLQRIEEHRLLANLLKSTVYPLCSVAT